MVNSYTRILPLVGHGILIVPRLLIDTSPIISRKMFQLFTLPQYLYLVIVHQCESPSDIPMSVCLDDGSFSFLWVVCECCLSLNGKFALSDDPPSSGRWSNLSELVTMSMYAGLLILSYLKLVLIDGHEIFCMLSFLPNLSLKTCNSLGSLGKIMAGLIISWGNVSQWPAEEVPPWFNTWTLMHGESLLTSCCSVIVRSLNS